MPVSTSDTTRLLIAAKADLISDDFAPEYPTGQVHAAAENYHPGRRSAKLSEVLSPRLCASDVQAGLAESASLGVGQSFARHYHEDMQEVFILVQGEAKLTVDQETRILRRGDTVVIDPREIHRMENTGAETVEYLAIGITTECGGKTVVVD